MNEFRDLVLAMMTIFREAWDILMNTGALQAFAKVLGQVAAIVWDLVVKVIGGAFAFFKSLFLGIWEAIKPAFTYLGKAFADIFGAFSEFLALFQSDDSSTFIAALKEVGSMIGNVIGTVLSLIIGFIGFLLKGLAWLIRFFIHFKENMAGIGDAITGGIGKALTWIRDKFNEYIMAPLRAVGDFFENLFDGIIAKLESAGKKARGIISAIGGDSATEVARNELAKSGLVSKKDGSVGGAFGAAQRSVLSNVITSNLTVADADFQAKLLADLRGGKLNTVTKGNTLSDEMRLTQGIAEAGNQGKAQIINITVGGKVRTVTINPDGSVEAS
jgi:hypothetical protein